MVGPTAGGKSDIAVAIAEHVGGEIVSVDSMQVYRGMDIGTAKASPDLQRRVPHHLLDLVQPEVDFAVAEFQGAGVGAIDELTAAGTPAILCGGSGLHFRSLVDPLTFPPRDPELRAGLELLDPAEARARLESVDPDAGAQVDLANPRRVVRALEVAELTGLTPSQRAMSEEADAVRNYRPARGFVAVGLDPGDQLTDRVVGRFDRMLAAGLVAEVEALAKRLGRLAGQAVGYKELLPVVTGEADLSAGRDAAIRATMALAKRQRTYFRRDPRIEWITWHPDPEQRLAAVLGHLKEAMAWSS